MQIYYFLNRPLSIGNITKSKKEMFEYFTIHNSGSKVRKQLHLPIIMQVIINDKFIKREHAVVSAFNRSFRYGDGFFETMKMIDGKIMLESFHFERMFIAIETLLFEKPSFFTASYFREKIFALAKKNNHEKAARIRLMFYRSDGGLYDAQNHYPNYIIETLPLPNGANEFNDNGLVTDIYLDARKVYDYFSHIKSNNFLP